MKLLYLTVKNMIPLFIVETDLSVIMQDMVIGAYVAHKLGRAYVRKIHSILIL
jgi:hypothetical protein